MLVSAQLTRLPPDSSGRSNGSVEVWMRPQKKTKKKTFFSPEIYPAVITSFKLHLPQFSLTSCSVRVHALFVGLSLHPTFVPDKHISVTSAMFEREWGAVRMAPGKPFLLLRGCGGVVPLRGGREQSCWGRWILQDPCSRPIWWSCCCSRPLEKSLSSILF